MAERRKHAGLKQADEGLGAAFVVTRATHIHYERIEYRLGMRYVYIDREVLRYEVRTVTPQVVSA